MCILRIIVPQNLDNSLNVLGVLSSVFLTLLVHGPVVATCMPLRSLAGKREAALLDMLKQFDDDEEPPIVSRIGQCEMKKQKPLENQEIDHDVMLMAKKADAAWAAEFF